MQWPKGEDQGEEGLAAVQKTEQVHLGFLEVRAEGLHGGEG